ncbi:DNA replication protein DnaC [Lacinutrix venerupis]|uniref:hypothetical protein n=1 Tax=Lacinutrix venerupis TaxID=1486034 RepID=UPI000EB37AD0|nr:hypothetical protein [Lacinutrix venerupis]RLJ61600.1 DNA replication protein DnaC [Lacinutrix venerupis]
MRINKIQKLSSLIPSSNNCKIIHAPSDIIQKSKSLEKQQLWSFFCKIFRDMCGKELKKDECTIANLKVLFLFFLRDKEFFKCKNLRQDISVASFDKGILIIGGYGLGKTDFFKVFEELFKHYPSLKYKFFTSKELVHKYEICQTPMDKKSFFKSVERNLMFIDDIGSERIGSNYGKIEVLDEVLSHRYDKKLVTYASCNYTNSEFCAKQTLIDIGKRYGGRLHDRLFEMFNIIEFEGVSYRR